MTQTKNNRRHEGALAQTITIQNSEGALLPSPEFSLTANTESCRSSGRLSIDASSKAHRHTLCVHNDPQPAGPSRRPSSHWCPLRFIYGHPPVATSSKVRLEPRGLYTILPLPILCGNWYNNGGSGGSIVLRDSVGDDGEEGVPKQRAGAQRIILIRAQEPRNKTISCIGQGEPCGQPLAECGRPRANLRRRRATRRWARARPPPRCRRACRRPSGRNRPRAARRIAQPQAPSPAPSAARHQRGGELGYTRYCFVSGPLGTNQYYSLRTHLLFRHLTPPRHRPHDCAI